MLRRQTTAVPETMEVKDKHAGCANAKPMGEQRATVSMTRQIKFSFTDVELVDTGICTTLTHQ